jgi:dephospho-CoA kinase
MIIRRDLVVAGNLGSGKSTVSGFLGELGWSVLDADRVGHQKLAESEIVSEVASRWATAVREHRVDRKVLADLVFQDRQELDRLEALLHPLIEAFVDEWLASTPGNRVVEVSVINAPRARWGPIAVVHAPEHLRIQRATARGMDQEDVRRRMAIQPPDQEWLAMAAVAIDNSGSQPALRKAVSTLDRWITSQ